MGVGMKKLIAICVIALLATGAGIVGINAAGPSKEQLEQDLVEVRSGIAAAEKEADTYKAGTAIRLQVEFRLATLRNTEAMLDQKRLSWLRGIDLSYKVPVSAQAAPPEVVSQLNEDLETAKADLAKSQDKAQGLGGFAQVLALMDVVTRRSTIAAIEQRYLMAKYGIFYPEVPEERKRPVPLGNKTNDKDAL